MDRLGGPRRRAMAEGFDTYLDRIWFRRTLARWRGLAERAGAADAGSLRVLRSQGRQLRRQIDRALHAADGRLARGAAAPIPLPSRADWAWRPELWSGPVLPPGLAAVAPGTPFGAEARLFHDCGEGELTLRQFRTTRASDLAPYGLGIEVFHFAGTFLSLALDLPEAGLRGLGAGHVLRLDVAVETERQTGMLARLNIRQGPNTEQMARDLPPGGAGATAEFDLAYAGMSERWVEAAWLDLIFAAPRMNRIVIRDLTLSRRPRAAL